MTNRRTSDWPIGEEPGELGCVVLRKRRIYYVTKAQTGKRHQSPTLNRVSLRANEYPFSPRQKEPKPRTSDPYPISIREAPYHPYDERYSELQVLFLFWDEEK